jgi:hypothetical protein
LSHVMSEHTSPVVADDVSNESAGTARA